ncbi:AAA family ATPase [Devosia sp. 2618]|uniref:AAA family ATPase n=1 Tax=Devosia sp. 2618 TaxID=3156454 RepID=UPI003393DB5E
MKLTALRLHNVKRFGGRGVAIEGIGEGVNVLTAANEHGKSTSFEALHALFFQPHTSTSKIVQLLRPYSGGNPLVEADIVTDAGAFRLTKQFYGGKRASVLDLASGRLVAQADEAEAFISELTRGGSAGPAGLLWVRQGVTGMERRSNSEEESDKRVRETLLTSVQGEVEALTGGRRMAEILAACEEELFRLVTATLRPKAGGRYAAAIEERERLSAEEARLKAEVEGLRAALDKRRLVRARLAEIEQADEQAARKAAIAGAEAAFESAKTHSDALKIAEAEAALALHRHDAAKTALDDYTAATQRHHALELRLGDAQQRRDVALQRRTALVADSQQARTAIEAAEANEREQRDLLARLDAALRSRDAAEKLAQLRARLDKAELARASVEDGQAALAANAIPAAEIDKLQALEVELVRLRAAQAATLPTVRVDYEPGSPVAISAAGTALDGGKDLSFANALRLDIAGVGTLTLRSNRPAQADAAIEQADARHAKLLASMGVESLAAARQRQAETQAKSAELDLARQRLADLAPEGVARLQAEIAQLVTATGDGLELKGDPSQVRQAHAAAEQAMLTTRNSARELQPLLDQASSAVVETETALAALVSELAGLDATLGPKPDRAARQAGLTQDQADRHAHHSAAVARALELRQSAHDLAAAEAALRRVRSVQDAAMQEAGQLRETLADLNGAISARADGAVEEVWQETVDLLAAASSAVARFETEVAVLDRLRRGLVAARSAARDLYLKPVVTELRPLLGLLFDDISIVFDEDTLLPQTVRRKGQDEDVDRLSGGMREQLSILTRLAFARLLARDGRPAPVILDDALVYSDDDRIERMFDALHQQSRDQQILVFSCRQRAFSKLGGNVLQMRDWVPPA